MVGKVTHLGKHRALVSALSRWEAEDHRLESYPVNVQETTCGNGSSGRMSLPALDWGRALLEREIAQPFLCSIQVFSSAEIHRLQIS